MTAKTKVPTYPTPADIAREVENIAPARRRYQEMQQALRDALDLAPLAHTPLGDLTTQALETGDIPTPEALLEAARAQLAEDRDRTFIRNVLDAQHSRFLTLPEAATTEQADEILHYLGETALPPVVTAIKAMPDDAPLTAEDALDHENGAEQLRAIRSLIAAYGAIRDHQKRASKIIGTTNSTSSPWSTMVTHSGIARDASEWEPMFLKARKREGEKYGQGLNSSGSTDAYEYFTNLPQQIVPAVDDRALWPTGCDDDPQRWRYLRRLTGQLEPWVPTWDELVNAHQANTERTSVATWVTGRTSRAARLDQFGRTHITEVTRRAGVAESTSTYIKR